MEHEFNSSPSEQILHTARFIETPGRNPEYILTYGGKKLTVILMKGGSEIMTFVENISDQLEPGATTELYRAARVIMQRIADHHQKTCLYVDRTKDSSMKEWFRLQGNQIFEWDSVEIDERPGTDSIFKKEFTPSSFV